MSETNSVLETVAAIQFLRLHQRKIAIDTEVPTYAYNVIVHAEQHLDNRLKASLQPPVVSARSWFSRLFAKAEGR